MNGGNERRHSTAVITVSGIGTIKVQTGSNLRETLRREGVYVDGTCSDKGTCGRCVVRIDSGNGGLPSDSERGFLGERAVGEGYRLACRVMVREDLTISIDDEHLLEVDRTGRWKEVWESPLWHPELISPDRSGYGVAVDLGSTSLAGVLIQLEDMIPLDIKAAANPQLPWGEDIISRLGSAAANPETAQELRNILWESVGKIMRSLCRRTGISPGRINRMVFVANSAVHHLFLGLSVNSLLKPPYSPASKAERLLSLQDLPIQLPLSREAEIHSPPLAGGYAGSDALASLLAARMDGTATGALIDVGTNTEIAVWRENSIFVATAPSGPAFEGGHISSGMRAEEGAVFEAGIEDGNVRFEVIGEGPVKGICGTGIVDLLAAMLDHGIVDLTGLLVKDSHPLLGEDGFRVSAESAVSLGGEDIATVQKAKSAIAATFQILLREIGLDAGDLEHVYLSGAFGSHLNLESAFRIGLLPKLSHETYVMAGNTALLGASMILLSGKLQSEARHIGKLVTHISVADNEKFEELFIDNLYFK